MDEFNVVSDLRKSTMSYGGLELVSDLKRWPKGYDGLEVRVEQEKELPITRGGLHCVSSPERPWALVDPYLHYYVPLTGRVV